MPINFTSDIQSLFSAKVVADAAYQAGGTFSLPAGFGALTLKTAAIAVAGTGYSAGNIVTLSGGTLYSGGAAATVKVVTVSVGVPTVLQIVTPGSYKIVPTNPISVTGGGGTNLTITATWTGDAYQRILTFVEVLRAYMAVIDNNHEAKILQDILGRMTASMRFGSPSWNTTTMPANAQSEALRFLAAHVVPSDI